MITREAYVEQSVQDFVRHQLFDVRGYPEEQVELLDAFPYERMEREKQLDKNYVACGFNFDDQGVQAELGSDLKTRRYTLEFFVFGLTARWGTTLANAVKFAADMEQTIPLLDVEDPTRPEFDRLVVLGTRSEHQPIHNPPPWQRHVWVTYVQVEDVYRAALV